MKIELHQFTIGEVVAGYRDSDEEGVVGYGGSISVPNTNANLSMTTTRKSQLWIPFGKAFLST